MTRTRFMLAMIVFAALGIAPAWTMGLGPEISGVAPNPVAPSPAAQDLTVSGRNFTDHLTLSITAPSGAVMQYRDRDISYQRDTSFQAAVRLPISGTYRLTVTNPDGRTSSAFALTVKAPAASPTVTAIEPAELTKSMSPQTVTILGTQFVPGLTVMVTDPAGTVTTISGSAVGQVSPTAVPITVALELAGDYSLVVTNPSGNSSNSFGFRVGGLASRPR